MIAAEHAPAPRRRARPDRQPPSAAAPIVKWVGGKSRLLPELVKRMPARFGRYFEPFAGGAALFFRVAPELAVIADTNRDLIACYEALVRDVEGVIARLERHREHHSEAHYYATRALWNAAAADPFAWPTADRAAAFIYLNRTCFNGLWRVNQKGENNVAIGRYVNPPICSPDALRLAAVALARADVRCCDYREALATAERGDFVYFDPPYDVLSPTSNFTSYTADAWGSDQQAELADHARELVARGCHVLLSNSDTPRVRALYDGFQIDSVSRSGTISCKAAKRGRVQELIITGGDR